MFKLQKYKKMSAHNAIDMLIANKGEYVYYIEFTDELRLSNKKYPNGELVLGDGNDFQINLGRVTYVGKL